MKNGRNMLRRKYNMIILLIAAFFVMPQFFMQVYGGASKPSTSGNNDVGSHSYEISSAGTYKFVGSTTKNYISVDCSGDVTIILSNVTINTAEGKDHPAIDIEDSSKVTIKLEGGNKLRGGKHDGIGTNDGYAGIRVNNSAQLTILGNGSLEAYGGGGTRGAAGIGGNYKHSCGKVTIGNGSDSPTVIADGSGDGSGNDGAAGIGGGFDGQANDGITINSGTVTATGGNGAAGIGGGQAYAAGSGGKVHNITINGGTVTATGGTDAAGIGGGESGTSGDGGNVDGIIITGGNITANGGENGAGIGGSKDAMANNINISGGTIKATGGKWAAGIGAGNAVGAGDGGTVDGLTITGGNITAKGGYGGAGIGGSDQGNVSGLKIEQTEGKELIINATGGDYGAGIGNSNTGAAGNAGVIQNDIGNIKITLKGGTITAIGGYGGAGIGGGNSKADKIEIYGHGKITAKGGDHSCGIGAGLKEDGGDIIIKGTDGGRDLKIDAHATRSTSDNDSATIGGADSAGGDIEISNADIVLDTTEGLGGAGIGSGYNHSMFAGGMGDITITNCNIKDNGYHKRHAATIGAGFDSLVDNITIKDSNITGGTIGGTDNTNRFIVDPTIQSITITGSTITAEGSSGQRAGIGSGVFSGIKKITITDSDVTASTVNGAGIGSGGYSSDENAFAKWTGNACGDITITRSKVTATGGDGGAGIGGGWGTPVGNVTITDCNSATDGPSIKATGGTRDKTKGGAGIGGGWAESAGDINISNSTVEAVAGGDSAGIGSSGAGTAATTLWNTTCNSIHIKNNSTVTAAGGKGGAGIGTGYGAQFGAYAGITINDSTVTAQGGDYGAGIGAGGNAAFGSGGESTYVDIIGKCKVTANGGVGGAGIGGGRDGGSDPVCIDLAETTREGDDWKYYVKAYGGKGAAGIGSGGVYVEEGELTTIGKDGKDIESVVISDGYVYAKGGDDDNGAGAGIGGGARGGNIDRFFVTGGVVEANAGSGSEDAVADDIGTGGEDNRDAADDYFKITGGTVLGGLSDDPEIIIDGGSVRHKTPNAKRSDGTAVYQTTMKVEESYFSSPTFAVTSFKDYEKKDIFSDGNKKIYLYLPVSEQDKATAEYHSGDDTYNKYYGTTTSDGNGWLKMDGVLKFKESEEHIVNEKFRLELDDAGMSGTVNFALEQISPAEKCIEIIDQSSTSPGAWVELQASDRVSYTVTASADSGVIDSEMYWGAKGTFSESISRVKEEIRGIDDPSKVYDGKPVSDPEITLASGRTDADVTYKYYDANGSYLGDDVKPVNAGEYSVQVSVEGNQYFTSAEFEKLQFTIKKRQITLGITASSEGSGAEVKVYAFDAADDPGKVTVKINDEYSQELQFVNKNNEWIAEAVFENVAGDADYQITAEYAESANYLEADDEAVYHKDKADRTLTVKDLKVTYGAVAGTLIAELSADQDNAENEYSYEVISQHADVPLELDVKPTIKLDANGSSAVVSYLNAGKAIVKVTVTHPSYNDAVAYAMITVNKAKLTVKSYVHKANDTTKEAIDTLTYGSVTDNVVYGLEYSGLVNAEKPDNCFENGHLAAASLVKTAQVGEHNIRIIKMGTPVNAGQGIKRIPFYSRNYELDLQPGTVEVVPAILHVNVNDAEGQYGMTEPEYSVRFGDADGNYGLMPWDTEADVIEWIGLKTSGKEYYEYKPDTYENEITVTTDTKNYKFTDANGKSTIINGTLKIEKGNLAADVSVPSYVYTGEVAEADIIVEPVASDDVDKSKLTSPGELKTVVFYEIKEDGQKKKMYRTPENAGSYIVVVTFEEDDYYNKAVVTDRFRILKAAPDVETPEVPDIYMRDGLELSDQQLPEGWEWADGSKELQAGYVKEKAIYTPEDTRNYRMKSAMIEFNVLEPDDGDDDGPGGSGNDDSTGGGDKDGNSDGGSAGSGDSNSDSDGNSNDGSSRTGDSMPIAAAAVLMIASLGGMAAVRFGRKKA